MEINVVILHKVVETIPQKMCSVMKVKCGLLQKVSFFGCILFIQNLKLNNVGSVFWLLPCHTLGLSILQNVEQLYIASVK